MTDHKEIFLNKINEAFAESDIQTILDSVTDDIRWTIIGNKTINGKKAFTEALHEMKSENRMELWISNIITHGDMAAVNGTIKSPNEEWFGFCDVYELQGYRNPKIKEMTSYVVELKEESKPQQPTVANYEKS